jgi:hypothetical protein
MFTIMNLFYIVASHSVFIIRYLKVNQLIRCIGAGLVSLHYINIATCFGPNIFILKKSHVYINVYNYKQLRICITNLYVPKYNCEDFKCT